MEASLIDTKENTYDGFECRHPELALLEQAHTAVGEAVIVFEFTSMKVVI